MFVLWVILRFGVNTPFWDQWAFAPLFTRLHDGSFSLSDLVAQHNDSRKVFPRLISLGLGRLTGWDVRWEMGVSFLLACGTSLCLHAMARRTIPGPPRGRLVLLVVANLLLFSLAQHENWLWGIQMVAFLPLACLAGCLAAAGSGLSPRAKFALCAGLATVATYSYANGMIVWVLASPLLLLDARDRERGRWVAVAWFTVACAVVLPYFWGFRLSGGPTPIGPARGGLREAVLFFLAFLGAPLGSGVGASGFPPSVAAGAVLVLLLLALAAYVVHERNDRELVRRALPWLLLAAYSLASAAAAAAGRVGMGARAATASRYATFALPLAVSVVHLVPLVLAHRVDRGRLGLEASARISTSLGTVLVGATLLVGAASWFRLQPERLRRLEGKACLAFLPVVPEPEYLDVMVFPYRTQGFDEGYLRERAEGLDAFGLLRPPLVRDADVRKLGAGSPGGGAIAGVLDPPVVQGAEIRFSGVAVLPGRGEPADAVLLCAEGEDGVERVFALACHPVPRNAGAPGAGRPVLAGWERSLPASRIPAGARYLTAWAFDALSGRAFLLDGRQPVPAPR